MKTRPDLPEKLALALRQNAQSRLETLRGYRLSWWAHWAALAEVYLPRRYRWFVTPNQYNRGSPMNQSIVDETGLLAARVLSTGMLSGLTSPTKPWFSLGIFGQDELSEGPEKAWLAEATRRLLQVLGNTNFYQALGTAYHDNVVFGSAAMICYEDPDSIVHFCNPALGEFFFALNEKNEVDTLYREYTYTVKQVIDEFGLENVSPGMQNQFKTAANLDTEVVLCHAIEPNTEVYLSGQGQGLAVSKKFKYREVYWEQTTQGGQKQFWLLRVRGVNEKSFSAFRWDVTSNDAYGRSPGMDALPATRQLQVEQRRKAEAIDKMVRPPMVASVSMKNEPMSIMPGGVSYVADVAGSGFKPAFTVEPRIGEMMEDLKEVQGRVQRTFFNDLFLGISQLGTVRTATEIEARQQETLVQIGPVIERTEGELDLIIDRVFAIMMRKQLFPPSPPGLQGRTIVPRYVSMFAETQRAAATTAVERLLQVVGGMVAVQPEILDNLDTDKLVNFYANQLNVEPEVVREAAAVAQIRQARGQQQQAAQQLQAGQMAAQAGQTLSQTDVGGGQNALQLMLGRTPNG